MRKYLKSSFLIFTTLAIVAIGLASPSASAQDDYHWWADSGHYADCVGAGPGTITATVQVDYYLPASGADLYEKYGLADNPSSTGPNNWSGSGSFQFTYPPANFTSYPVTFIDNITIVIDGETVVKDNLSFTCDGPGTVAGVVSRYHPNAPEAGCDAYVPIPEQAVGGQFVSAAEVYWAPGKLVSPQTIIDPGKTYLVVGQDESGQYRKVLVSCTYVWVRAETVGPNPQAPWNGQALPTDVVD